MNELLSKIDELHNRINNIPPLSRETALLLKEYYKVGLTWSSNAIEGNTLTESETKTVLEDGLAIGGKPLREHFEILGHAEAFEYILGLTGRSDLFNNDILMLHRLLYKRIDEVNAGVYRKSHLFVNGSHYPLPAPEKLNMLMESLMKKISLYRENEHPVVAAAKAHLDFVFIHPFVDGNGRIARLLMNLILMQHGYNVALISPVFREEYVSTIESAHKNSGPFIKFISRTVYETEMDYLKLFDL